MENINMTTFAYNRDSSTSKLVFGTDADAAVNPAVRGIVRDSNQTVLEVLGVVSDANESDVMAFVSEAKGLGYTGVTYAGLDPAGVRRAVLDLRKEALDAARSSQRAIAGELNLAAVAAQGTGDHAAAKAFRQAMSLVQAHKSGREVVEGRVDALFEALKPAMFADRAAHLMAKAVAHA